MYGDTRGISPAREGGEEGFPRANLRPSIRDPIGREEYTVCVYNYMYTYIYY